MEGENPTRRYKWFRPRQAVTGSFSTPTPTNWATIWLYNDSTAGQVMVIRNVTINPNLNAGLQYFERKGKSGILQAGGLHNYIQETAKLAGVFYYSDEATQFTDDILGASIASPVTWNHEFPFRILQPGWSLVAQALSSGANCGLIATWESIEADELDFIDW